MIKTLQLIDMCGLLPHLQLTDMPNWLQVKWIWFSGKIVCDCSRMWSRISAKDFIFMISDFLEDFEYNSIQYNENAANMLDQASRNHTNLGDEIQKLPVNPYINR